MGQNRDFYKEIVQVKKLAIANTSGPVVHKVISGSDLKALLTGSAQPLLTLSAGDRILDVQVNVTTAVGATCTLNVGANGTFTGSSAVGNAFINAQNINTTASYRMLLLTPTSGVNMPACAADGGTVTITSSTDATASSFVGEVVVVYAQKTL